MGAHVVAELVRDIDLCFISALEANFSFDILRQGVTMYTRVTWKYCVAQAVLQLRILFPSPPDARITDVYYHTLPAVFMTLDWGIISQYTSFFLVILWILRPVSIFLFLVQFLLFMLLCLNYSSLHTHFFITQRETRIINLYTQWNF
jgi:hypothetical protein